MYNKLLNLKNKKILSKYELLDIDLSNIFLYKQIHDFLSFKPKLKDSIFLVFKNSIGIKEVFEITIEKKIKIKLLSNNKNHNDFKKYLYNIFFEYEKDLGEDKINAIFSLPNNFNKIKLVYYFFGNFLDYNSFLILKNSKKHLYKNKEPFILELYNNSYNNLIYNSDRSKIYKNENILEKKMFWINSIHGTSKEQLFINSIFLSKFGYINKVLINLDDSISFFYKYKENSIKQISLIGKINSLIKLNIKTFLGYNNGLKISYIQEDPNKDNFVGIDIIDFDVVNISYSFLQPIYLILDLFLWKDLNNKYAIKIFKYIIFFFIKNEYYKKDFKLLGGEKIFQYYNKIYTKGLEENNDWLGYDLKNLKNKKEILIKNKESILIFLENEIK